MIFIQIDAEGPGPAGSAGAHASGIVDLVVADRISQMVPILATVRIDGSRVVHIAVGVADLVILDGISAGLDAAVSAPITDAGMGCPLDQIVRNAISQVSSRLIAPPSWMRSPISER